MFHRSVVIDVITKWFVDPCIGSVQLCSLIGIINGAMDGKIYYKKVKGYIVFLLQYKCVSIEGGSEND